MIRRSLTRIIVCPIVGWDVAETDIEFEQRPSVDRWCQDIRHRDRELNVFGGLCRSNCFIWSPLPLELRRDSLRRGKSYTRWNGRKGMACRAETGGAGEGWWAWVDLNYRPRPYQGRALAT